MEYQNITALLGLATLELHAGTFGMGKPFAKISEEHLEKIDTALGKLAEVEELKQQLSDATAKAETYEKITAETVKAIDKAMETAGLEKQEGLVENISLLGEKCKEYGESKDRHSFAENNGEDKETEKYIDGYINPNDAHNQLISKL